MQVHAERLHAPLTLAYECVTSKPLSCITDEIINHTANLTSHWCRSKLFTVQLVTSHELAAARTVFKVGEEGLCTAAVFVSCVDAQQLVCVSKLAVVGHTVECGSCGCKLGQL